ncbi:U4/U6-U5 snRNP complex subunit PRP4 Ecym_2808 [Eremothecium cymbalariae DBVPG|uniref:Uncharacterized protein n=1 Tax=Eremothecium cymbalariae (strain CBS 270.75 / DBVPG 7215 / KCTC 17166 / NRRL Y-17582) TaxID=931890 RepID=G8JQE2_ERECY|nr:Hypothetical protein Ecym_2808 [Eremothecium cymbalariae DBVPG\
MVGLDDIKVDHNHKIGNNGETVADALKRLEFQRQQRMFLLPTLDEEVRAALNWLHKPEELKNEDQLSRRERLAELLYSDDELLTRFKASPFGYNAKGQSETSEDLGEGKAEEEEFYTPASWQLIESRKSIIKYSMENAHARLLRQRRIAENLSIKKLLSGRRNLNKKLRTLELAGSQLVAEKPVSEVCVSKDDVYVASGNWGGHIKVLNSDTLDIVKSFDNVHSGKVCGLDWHPTANSLLSGGADNLVKITNLDQGSCAELKDHVGRVCKVKFHPSGKFAASASFDMTWILWDLEKALAIQLQEGHSREVFTLGFQTDGSLLASGGLDSIGLIWDLRSGEPIMNLVGHQKPIYGLDWSPNGYQVATASGDGSIKIWDLRKQSIVSTLLAHRNVAFDIKFDKANGHFLVSGGYDRELKIFNADNWELIKTLEGHTDKILSVDLVSDGSKFFSTGWDRTVKQWTLSS